MAEPLGKREMLAWTVAGVLAVVAAIAYAKRPEPAPIPPLPVSEIKSPLTQPVKFDTVTRTRMVGVISDSRDTAANRALLDSLKPVISTPLRKREPSSASDTGCLAKGDSVALGKPKPRC